MNRLDGFALLVLLLSVMIYGIIEWRSSLVEQKAVIDDELAPDFIAETLNSTTFTKTGQLSHTIKADRMEHYSGLAVSHFELPHYTLHPKHNASPWQLSANEAILYKDNRVVLNNKVRLTATAQNSLIEEIHCKYLELDLTTNIISSEQAVLVIGKDFTTYGSGLIIDLNTKQMTLTEHIRTIYEKT